MHHRPAHLLGTTVLLGLGAVALPLAAPAVAESATFVVTNAAPTGPGTLDQAVLDANANPGRDTIRFDLDPGVNGIVTAPEHPLRITDAVVIDACADDGDPLTEPGVIVQSRAATTLLVEAPDVTVQGISLPGALRPVDVTSTGDRFVYRNAVLSGTIQTFRVTGAEDVVVGGGGATGCVGDGGVFLIGATDGFEFVDAIGARLQHVVGRNLHREAVLVTGGRGTQLLDLHLEGQTVDGIPMIRLDAAGTASDPIRLAGGRINHCRGECILVANGSHLDLGAPGVRTEVQNNLGRPAVPIRIEGSSANIHDAFIGFGQLGGIVVGAGAFDVTIARNDIGDNRADGIRLEGAPAPRNVRITGNAIGYLGASGGTPTPFSNFDLGIQVDAVDGLRIEGNLISTNRNGGVELHGAASNVTIAGNRIGSDPITEQVPGVPGTTTIVQPFGVVVRGASGVTIEDNVVAANTLLGIGIVDGSTGVLVRRNRVGTNTAGTIAAGNGGGIAIGADDVAVHDNIVGGNAGAGVLVSPGADRATITGNRVGGPGLANGAGGIVAFADDVTITGNQVGANGDVGILAEDGAAPLVTGNTVIGNPRGIVVASGATVSGNRLGVRPDGTIGPETANGTGIEALGNDNLITGNVVTNTATPDRAVFVWGQRNRITRAAMAGNTGHAVDLRDSPPAPTLPNGGIVAPTIASATDVKTAVRVVGSVPVFPSNRPTVVDVYASRTCGPDDHEAERWLGQLTVTNGRFDDSLPLPPWGFNHLTATAADAEGDTSELSACAPVVWRRPAPNPPLPPIPFPPPILP